MRILATALAVMTLTVSPVHAGTSTLDTAREQTKPEAGAAQLSESQAASMPNAEPTAAGTKKPTEQTATQTDATAEPKPEQSAQTNSTEHDSSPAKS